VNGWEVVEVFKDQAISGDNGRDRRPALDVSARKQRAIREAKAESLFDLADLGAVRG
jgi:hypothetical protein